MIKDGIRTYWRRVRQSIPENRRQIAEKNALKTFIQKLSPQSLVLSYTNFSDEFSTQSINEYLAKHSQLMLPRVSKNNLEIYLVDNPEADCEINQWGILEPKQDKCQKIDPLKICHVLVPGLAFDILNHRLGYGKGFYDRFLSTLNSQTKTYGLGFSEQLSKSPLPVNDYDISLDALLLF